MSGTQKTPLTRQKGPTPEQIKNQEEKNKMYEKEMQAILNRLDETGTVLTQQQLNEIKKKFNPQGQQPKTEGGSKKHKKRTRKHKRKNKKLTRKH